MASININSKGPKINLPSDFKLHDIDERLGAPRRGRDSEPDPPLGVLENFTGNFAGKGFNLIFRPNSRAPSTTVFDNPVPDPQPPAVPNESVLQLSLTTENLAFSPPIGNTPNRGLQEQNDIFLNGVPYVQSVSDVTNKETGKGDAPPQAIHFEPGLWMHVPATADNPVLPESLNRMASIPHGTTINAQCPMPTSSIAGPPVFATAIVTPTIHGGTPRRFAAQTAADINTPRLPQDLTKFIAEGTITQEILDDPNKILQHDNEGKSITNTIVFTVSTSPDPAVFFGGGTDNIAFLEGGSTGGTQTGPNANATQMDATFWISTVQQELVVPAFKPGDVSENCPRCVSFLTS